MSRVIVIGGHGRTGILIVEKLIAAGHGVVATIRNVKHMAELVKRGAETVMLDLEKSPLSEITLLVKGADAMVFAAGSAAGEGSALDRIGTRRTLHAARNAGVKRYVAISSIGASTGLSTRSMSEEMKDYYRQKRAAAKLIRASGLDWTILEPGELTDTRGTGRIAFTEAALTPASIPRADVAATVVVVLATPRTRGHAYQLTSGKTPIAAAVKAAIS